MNKYEEIFYRIVTCIFACYVVANLHANAIDSIDVGTTLQKSAEGGINALFYVIIIIIALYTYNKCIDAKNR